ncbi:MAG: TIGR02147 family protein [Oligoflexales bacterium]|nr:TIGR02147 family protein [Oligoflexales bacterium]
MRSKNVNSKKIIKECAKEFDISKYLEYRQFLSDVYKAVKAQVKPYSYLQFAEDLGFSKTNVIRLIIIGKRPITLKAGEKIAKAFDLLGPSKKYWIALIAYSNERYPTEREKLFTDLLRYRAMCTSASNNDLQMEYFSEWYHPIIREMVGLTEFDGSPDWIKDRLAFPLRLEKIKQSLALLEEIGVIQLDQESGKYKRSREKIMTDTEIDSMAIIRYHQKMIEAGKESITRVDEDLRDIRAMTACFPRSVIPKLKDKIHNWLLEAIELEEEADDVSDVYQLNIQLFPFTKT